MTKTMVSSRNIAANRRNAWHSTGPRTAKGKDRSRQNALRHGLAVRPPWSGAIDIEVERLASQIAGPNPDPCRLHFARIAAEAELELRRVRTIRVSLLASGMPAGSTASMPGQEPHAAATTLLNLPRLDRYEQRALSRRNRALRLM
jgi:hypothetical protein